MILLFWLATCLLGAFTGSFLILWLYDAFYGPEPLQGRVGRYGGILAALLALNVAWFAFFFKFHAALP